MAEEVRDFDEEFGYGKKTGVKFKLGGQTFRTKAVIHPGAFLADVSGLDAAIEYLRWSLVAEDRKKFEKLLIDPDVLVSAHQIDKISAWVVEQISGRPTESPGSSGGGAGRTSRTSKVASLSQAKTGSG